MTFKCIYGKKISSILASFIFSSCGVFAQCPLNIDFEKGNFTGWTCWVGTVEAVNSENIIYLQPVAAPLPNQHTMLTSVPGDGLDEYGGFPKNCPNGSGYSIKLGNDLAGGSAEGISYEFVIPPTSNKFSITYNYALVFEDPNHEIERQPRLEIEVIDITEGVFIDCFSFSYVAYGGLSGFTTSSLRPHDSPVRYKGWTENTIHLNGYQGKTIRFFVKTADCTYSLHFGYAYIDVSSKCENSLVGAAYCPEDTSITVNAPSGYQNYKWYNSNYSQVLGTQQALQLNPPPASGTVLNVELLPFPGYGCKDTLVVDLRDTLTVSANAGPDRISCNRTPVQIGTFPIGGIIYKWTPSTGLNNPDISNPIALPDTETIYTLTTKSAGGGCMKSDVVKVSVNNLDNNLELIGKQTHCLGDGPNPILKVMAADSVQWYKDNFPIQGANQTSYPVNESGSYYAVVISDICTNPLQTRSINMILDTAVPGISYPELDLPFNFPVQLQARGRDFANSVLWSPPTNLNRPNTFDPYFKGVQPRVYTIELKTIKGCTTIDTQVVKTHKEIAIYVPSVFTPDGNGKNDYLRPLLLGFEKLKFFRIFNRGGKLIFETQSDLPGWNGRFGNNPLETQSVVWMLEAIDVDGKSHFRKGSTLLIH